MTMDREKEREIELESAMYANCLLLGLDTSAIGGNNGIPHVGQFRHSNPKLGEQLLYFILSCLRGPNQSAKDFDKLWPIYDSSQSRDFRKVVQSIISELESQGALPKSNSRVSSLATCCGPRFVELLWQLSVHALREVHRRTYADDVASNPLPASLTDVAFSHAASLLSVTKARIGLERRRFLKNAEEAVQRETVWSNLADEMTAEYRSLCAEEAYLHQEHKKLLELESKAKLEDGITEDHLSCSNQDITKATRVWELILAQKSKHESLASGPIEDLITHREHRYRISGSALLGMMDQSSQHVDSLSGHLDSRDHNDEHSLNVDGSTQHSSFEPSDESLSRSNNRNRVHHALDVAEVFRRWTHALQRVQKQSLQLAKSNSGEGPVLLQSSADGTSHSESLSATLSEHCRHLANIKVLINQLKDAAPALQKSISELTDEVNRVSSSCPSLSNHNDRSSLPIHDPMHGGALESTMQEVIAVTSKLSAVKLDNVSDSDPPLKLPQLFNSMASSGKAETILKQPSESSQNTQYGNMSVEEFSSSHGSSRGCDISYVDSLKRAVREAALSVQPCCSESMRDSNSEVESEHFFMPISGNESSPSFSEKGKLAQMNALSYASQINPPVFDYPNFDGNDGAAYSNIPDMVEGFRLHPKYDKRNGFSFVDGQPFAISDVLYNEDANDQALSPPLLLDPSFLADSYEDLLAPLSEIETAMMEH